LGSLSIWLFFIAFILFPI